MEKIILSYKMSTSIQSLDNTALQALIETMPLESILALCGTNKYLNTICDDPNGQLWVLLMQRDFSDYLKNRTYTSHKAQYNYLSRRREQAYTKISNRSPNIQRIINLPNSILYGIDFNVFQNFTNIIDSNFGGSDVSHAIFRTQNSEITIDMRYVNFSKAKLNNTLFDNVILEHCNFTNAELIGVKFIDSVLEYAQFTDANLQDSDFTEVGLNNLSRMNFTNANLGGANFIGVSCHSSIICNANLKGIRTHHNEITSFTDCNFAYSDLSQTVFRGVNFAGSTFDSTICTQTDFTEADLSECIFDDANLEGAIFNNAIILTTQFLTSNN